MEVNKVKTSIHVLLAVLAVYTITLPYGWAGQLEVTYDASNGLANGQTANADHINRNFSDVEAEVNDNDSRIVRVEATLPVMWASTDEGPGIDIDADSGSVETNSVYIDAPSDGFLIISGNLFINNNGELDDNFRLCPCVDGGGIFGQSFAVAAEAQENGTAGERISLAYTVTVPITAGPHTVSQEVWAVNHEDAFFYNRNNLTVLFIPSSLGTYSAASVGAFTAGTNAIGEAE
jgi:hypothetical protein